MLSLYPHPATPCSVVHSLQVRVERTEAGGLFLQYLLSGDLAQILFPAPQAPAFTDGLWEHTCFELFVGVQGESAYREFNFSPPGQWAAYAFNVYRERVGWQVQREPVVRLVPVSETGKGSDGVLLEVWVSAVNLPPKPDNKPFELALTAVIETITGEKSYWALKHPAEHPDFHHRNGFIHEIWP